MNPVTEIQYPKANENNNKIVFFRSYLSQLPKIILFIISIGLLFYTALKMPWSVQHANLGEIFGQEVNLSIPLFGIIPLVLIFWIGHELFDEAYIIGDSYVLEIRGRASLSARNIQIDFPNIRAVEIEQSLLQRILGLGDLHIATSASQSMPQLTMQGISNPEYYKEVLELRLKNFHGKKS